MRKILVLLFLLVSVIAEGRKIPESEAAAIAYEFLNSNVRQTPAKAEVRRAIGRKAENTGDAPFYVFNAEDNQGFVIVSGDDRTQRILGYSDTGNFDFNNLPPQLDAILCKFANRIASLPQTSVKSQSWDTPLPVDAYGEGKLLKTANWGQGYPYNAQCPEMDGYHCVTGCVATAMAIIMKYHNWPNQGKGETVYDWNGQQLSASFDSSFYDWTKILDDYSNTDDLSIENINEVAHLMHDVGYAIHAGYGIGATHASNLDASIALVDNFRFHPCLGSICLMYCSTDYFISVVKSEIDNNRPLLFTSLKTPNGTDPHTYVGDGYDNNGYIHFNWGWDGYANGYYSIDPLKGIFGTHFYCNYGFLPESLSAPKLPEGPMVGASGDFSYWADNLIHCDYTSRYFYTEEMPKITVGYTVKNNSTNEEIFCGNRGGSVQDARMDFTIELPDGEYTIYPAYQEAGESWQKCLVSDLYQSSIGLTIADGIKTFVNRKPKTDCTNGAIEIDGICYILDDDNMTAEVTYRNELYNSYSGDITIPALISFNDKKYTVNSIGEYAFRGCHSLGYVELPNTIENLGNGCFMDVLYKYINLGELEKLTTIDNSFYFNYMSTDNAEKFSQPISLPKNIQHLGDEAFTNVYFGLLEIPESLTSIGSLALSRNKIDAIKFTRTDLSDISFSETAFNDGYHYNPNTFPILLFPESVMDEYLALDAFKKHDIVKGYKDKIIQAEHLDIYINGKVIEEGSVIYANPNETIEFESRIAPINATIEEISFNILESDDPRLLAPWSIYVPYEDGVYKYQMWHYYNYQKQDDYKHYVTCMTRDGSKVTRNFTISVYSLIKGLVLSENNLSLKIGESKKLDFSFYPTNVNTELISWKSLNTDVATVDQYGNVTAVAIGNAIITLSATDGSGVSATCEVVVTVATGIDDILSDTNTYVRVFNLSGILVYEGIYSKANLAPGFYIVKCNGKNIKVKI